MEKSHKEIIEDAISVIDTYTDQEIDTYQAMMPLINKLTTMATRIVIKFDIQTMEKTK